MLSELNHCWFNASPSQRNVDRDYLHFIPVFICYIFHRYSYWIICKSSPQSSFLSALFYGNCKPSPWTPEVYILSPYSCILDYQGCPLRQGIKSPLHPIVPQHRRHELPASNEIDWFHILEFYSRCICPNFWIGIDIPILRTISCRVIKLRVACFTPFRSSKWRWCNRR